MLMPFIRRSSAGGIVSITTLLSMLTLLWVVWRPRPQSYPRPGLVFYSDFCLLLVPCHLPLVTVFHHRIVNGGWNCVALLYQTHGAARRLNGGVKMVRRSTNGCVGIAFGILPVSLLHRSPNSRTDLFEIALGAAPGIAM